MESNDKHFKRKVKPVYVWSISAIIILIVRVALYCLKINDAWEIIASVVETLNLVSIIILTQKTADIEEKQYCLQASKAPRSDWATRSLRIRPRSFQRGHAPVGGWLSPYGSRRSRNRTRMGNVKPRSAERYLPQCMTT